MNDARQEIERKFMANVSPEPNSGCWLWTGGGVRNGYGQFYANGRQGLAHRFAYEYFREPIKPGLQIDHLCRVRCCVNPNHLEVVTNRENCKRGKATLTRCKNGHQLSDDNVRKTTLQQRGWRLCLECRRSWRKKYRKPGYKGRTA